MADATLLPRTSLSYLCLAVRLLERSLHLRSGVLRAFPTENRFASWGSGHRDSQRSMENGNKNTAK